MKHILIIENSKNSLKVNENNSTKNPYNLTGLFTDFDIVNRNNRIYTADEFVPHVKTMMEKKEWGVIYGELDHPDVFDISLKNVSHVIENAYYNKEKNRVDGEIRLLSSDCGKIARSLVDDGLPLFVSSRAAGITESNGHVKLKQLFTYDIVADPGFANAKMQVKSMNESLGFKENNSFMLIESNRTQLSELNSKYDKLYNTRTFDFTNESDTNDYFNMNKNDAVTKKDLTKWSNYLIGQMNENTIKINKTLKSNSGNEDLSRLLEEQDELKESFAKMTQYLDYLADKLQFSVDKTLTVESKTSKLVNYCEYLAETLDSSIQYSNYLAEGLDKNIDYSNYLAEKVEHSIDYSEYIAENLTKSIHFSEYIAENLSNNISYSEYLAENLNNNIAYGEYLAENLDNTIAYGEYLAENVDTTINYTQYIAENLDMNIGYTQYIGENLETNINYSDYLSECIDNTMEFANTTVKKINKSNGVLTEKLVTAEKFMAKKNSPIINTVNEGKTVGDFKKKLSCVDKTDKDCEDTKKDSTVYKTETNQEVANEYNKFISSTGTQKIEESLVSKISSLITEAKKREVSKDVTPRFYHFITPTDIANFEALSESNKEDIKVALNENTYYNRHDVMKTIQSVLSREVQNPNTFLLESMPADIKKIWSKVDNKMKKSIISQSVYYDVSNKIMAENFWNTRNFDFITLNEKLDANKKLLEKQTPYEHQYQLSDEMKDYYAERLIRLK